MIQIYICEDEKIQLEFWKRTIEDYIKSAKIMAEIVSARQNPQDILNDIEQCDNSQRLFFIDIQMPEYDMNGLELARKLREMIIWCSLRLKMILHIRSSNTSWMCWII